MEIFIFTRAVSTIFNICFDRSNIVSFHITHLRNCNTWTKRISIILCMKRDTSLITVMIKTFSPTHFCMYFSFLNAIYMHDNNNVKMSEWMFFTSASNYFVGKHCPILFSIICPVMEIDYFSMTLAKEYPQHHTSTQRYWKFHFF